MQENPLKETREGASLAASAVQGLLALAPNTVVEGLYATRLVGPGCKMGRDSDTGCWCVPLISGRCLFPSEVGEDSGHVREVRCWVEAGGVGDLEVIGDLWPCSRRAVRVALTWLGTHIKVLRKCLRSEGQARGKQAEDLLWRVSDDGGGLRQAVCLHSGTERGVFWQGNERLMVRVEGTGRLIGGRSLTVAAALSLLGLALRCQLDQTVAVSGDMDLRGNIYDVEGLAGKLQGCMARGIRTLLVPETSLPDFDISSLKTPELQEYAKRALKGYSSLTEAMQATLLGGELGVRAGDGHADRHGG